MFCIKGDCIILCISSGFCISCRVGWDGKRRVVSRGKPKQRRTATAAGSTEQQGYCHDDVQRRRSEIRRWTVVAGRGPATAQQFRELNAEKRWQLWSCKASGWWGSTHAWKRTGGPDALLAGVRAAEAVVGAAACCERRRHVDSR